MPRDSGTCSIQASAQDYRGRHAGTALLRTLDEMRRSARTRRWLQELEWRFPDVLERGAPQQPDESKPWSFIGLPTALAEDLWKWGQQNLDDNAQSHAHWMPYVLRNNEPKPARDAVIGDADVGMGILR